MIKIVKVSVGYVVIERRQVNTDLWQDGDCILLPCKSKWVFNFPY